MDLYGRHINDGQSWYLAWLEAFAVEVASRYDAMRARLDADSGMSLVLVSVREEAEKFANERVAAPDAPKKETAKGGRHPDAHESGREAARKANLRPSALDAPESSEPTLIEASND
jgi:hypothetical protein